MRVTAKERESAIEYLLEILKPGDTVYTVLRNVSRSGMQRAINVYAIKDGEPRWIAYRVAQATGFTYGERYECLSVGGCGMDMGFHVVSTLSAVLYPDGFGCIGEKCPSSDHSNGDRDYTSHSDKQIGWESCDQCCENASPCNTHSHWHKEGCYTL